MIRQLPRWMICVGMVLAPGILDANGAQAVSLTPAPSAAVGTKATTALSNCDRPLVLVKSDLDLPAIAPVNPNYLMAVSEAAPRPLSKQRLTLGGIAPADSEQKVRAVLGKPSEVSNSFNDLLGPERYLFYSKQGIHAVQLVQDKASGKFEVVYMIVNDRGAATQDGVRVGDSRQMMLKVYGTPSSIEQQGDTVQVLSYNSQEIRASLSFTLLGDRITEIKLNRYVDFINLGT